VTEIKHIYLIFLYLGH